VQKHLVPPSPRILVVVAAVVCALPRVAVAAVSTLSAAVAGTLLSAAQGLVVGAAGPAVVASTTTAASSVVAVAASSGCAVAASTIAAIAAWCAAAETATFSGTARTGGSAVWRTVAVGLVADAASSSTKSSSATAAETASSSAAEASAAISTEAAATPAASTESALEATTTGAETSGTNRRTEAARSSWTASRRPLGVASSTQSATKAARTPARHGATTLYIDEHATVLDLDAVRLLVGGLHVFLALVDDECVAALALLGRRVRGRSDIFDDPDALDGTVAAEFAFEVVRGDAVGEARHEERLESVALNLGVFAGLVCGCVSR
jgi:hypothetical protein